MAPAGAHLAERCHAPSSSGPPLLDRHGAPTTATFHYLLPQLAMGLAPLIVVCKVLTIRHSIEDPYSATLREITDGAPQEVMFQFAGVRMLEAEYLTASGIDPGH